MAQGGKLIVCEKGWDGGPAVAVHLNGHSIIVTSFQGDKRREIEVFDGIEVSWPLIIVGLEMKAKTRNGGTKVGRGSDAFGAAFEECAEMLLTRAYCHGQDAVAVELP